MERQNPLKSFERQRVSLTFPANEGRTIQSLRDESNINSIMEKWRITGELPRRNDGEAQYGDFTTVASFQAAQETVLRAEEAFASLPARVRDRMKNEPRALLDFLNDPDNLDEAVKLGLVDAPSKPPAEPAPEPESATPISGGE